MNHKRFFDLTFRRWRLPPKRPELWVIESLEMPIRIRQLPEPISKLLREFPPASENRPAPRRSCSGAMATMVAMAAMAVVVVVVVAEQSVQDTLCGSAPARHSGARARRAPPSMPAGSTWWRSRSACCAASAWTGASTIQELSPEIAAWERQRNAAKARINWMFTTEKARAKLGPAYPDTSKKS